MSNKVKPFKAAYYNPSLIRDNSLVVCPPYDVINKKQLAALRKKSPYNFSKILIADNKNYKKIRTTLEQWIKKQILIDDEKECFYLYEQTFSVEGKKYKRFGILSLLKMDKKNIFAHEYTLKAPKVDRAKIITTVEANLSPVFIIAAKASKVFLSIYNEFSKQPPFLEIRDDENSSDRLWRICDKENVDAICAEIAKTQLVIADGHHRFEISYDYFQKNKHKFKDLDYILAYVSDYQEGLNILPTHRIIEVKDDKKEFFKKLDKYFTINESTQSKIEEKLKTKGEFIMGVYRDKKFYLLELKSASILDKLSNKVYKDIDTYVFHDIFLPLFKYNGEIEYTHSVGETKELAGRKKTAFILRAASLESVVEISRKGFKLPQKSTYFYPKLLSGLVIRRFEKLRSIRTNTEKSQRKALQSV